MRSTRKWWRWKPWVISCFIFGGLLIVMDSCLQFRMSQSEIDHYFKNKKYKGRLYSYDEGKHHMNYLAVGDTTLPTVIFVHGSPGSLSAFIDFMSDSLLLRRAHLISVDRPGFGSSNFGYAEPSLQQQAEALRPILQRYRHGRPIILVGHSLGGPVIARLAMDYPELVDRLIIVAGSIDPDLEPKEWFRAPMATPFLKWMLPRSFRASNDEIYKLKPELQEMLPLWKKITTPTIVIQGNKDVLVHPDNASFAKKMIVNAPVELTVVEDMNHFVPWSHPHLIRQAIIKSLEEGYPEAKGN